MKVEDIDVNDQSIYDFIEEGNTNLVFQLNSKIGKKYTKEMKPKNVDELAMLLALIRPNMLDAGLDKEFISVRNGEMKPDYPNSKIGIVLDETHGCSLYQEQIIKIGKVVAGFNDAQADLLRHSVGKKEKKMMRKVRRPFLEGGIKNGYTLKELRVIWNKYIKAAARYSFNLSHATSYAYTSARTAYLHCHYPLEFICANLKYADGDFDKVKAFISVANGQSIRVLPPKLSNPENDFSILGKDILFGITHIKGVGKSSIDKIKNLRNTHSINEYIYRTAILCELDKTSAVALINSGATDHLERNRKKTYRAFQEFRKLSKKEYASIVSIIDRENKINEENSVTHSYDIYSACKEMIRDNEIKKYITKKRFEKFKMIIDQAENVPDITKEDYVNHIKYERDLLGVSLTGCESDIYDSVDHICLDVKFLPNKSKVELNVVIEDIFTIDDKNGNEMAFIEVFDSSYRTSAVVFSKQWERLRGIVGKYNIVKIKGVVDKERGESILVNKMEVL